ncbi:UNVERIFIED_CONTAM: hypothetical protein HDU68_001998 [Siphonaria sp. JEL0065]|nr:hypothetical protein HDU68_001998 [Siphonaria sp. JEL0065]
MWRDVNMAFILLIASNVMVWPFVNTTDVAQVGKNVAGHVFVFMTVCHFFGEGIRFNKGTLLGGTACKDQVDGACNDEKTKGAYPDIPLVLNDRVAIVEVDENRHQYYNQSCELARYDTLQFGTGWLLPTRVFRFNPHDTATLRFDFTSKLMLIQRVRNYLNEELEIGAAPVASVEWLYYGQESKQRTFAEQASGSLCILPDVNDLSISLDADIAAFTLSDLGSLDSIINSVVVEKISDIGGHECQCNAICSPNNPLKRKRCSQARMKNSSICLRHSKIQLAGKTLVFHNNDVDVIARD